MTVFGRTLNNINVLFIYLQWGHKSPLWKYTAGILNDDRIFPIVAARQKHHSAVS